MKAFITGVDGFIGRHFKDELRRRGWAVRGVDIQSLIFGTPNDAMDVFTRHSVREQFDLVIHAAARTPHRAAIDGNPAAAAYNQLLDAAMFNWAIETKQKRVLFLSSSAVYSDDLVDRFEAETPFQEDFGMDDDPFDVYGETKRAGERLAYIARQCGIKVTIVRPFSGYGSDQSTDFPFGAFIKRAVNLEDPFTIWGNADQQRDFVHVDDIVNGSLALVEANVIAPVNICTGVATSMRELVEMIVYYGVNQNINASYDPDIVVDEDAPLGVMYRVGDPSRLLQYYKPQWTLANGVGQALEEATRGSA